MSQSEMSLLPPTLTGSLREYRVIDGANLLSRVDGFYEWQDARRREGFWPYGRSTDNGPKSECAVADDAGARSSGVNFGSQDYLSLSNHPAIREAAHEAIDRYGVHSAGSPAFMGNTRHLDRPREENCRISSDGARRSLSHGLGGRLRRHQGPGSSTDHIVMDALAHACLQDGASGDAQYPSVLAISIDAAAAAWPKIRAKDTQRHPGGHRGPVLDGFGHARLRGAAGSRPGFNATLMVDVAHDLGCLGADGRGHIGMQKMLGKIDIVMGSFSKTFASNGGFVACKSQQR